MRRHRLFVVIPFLVLALVLSVRDGLGYNHRAELLPIEIAGERAFAFGNEGRGWLFDGATLEVTDSVLHLTAGSVLVHSDGITDIHAGDVRLRGWAGGFHATFERGGVRIAALTTPVLVETPGGRTIVPVRAQWASKPVLAASADGMEGWLKDRISLPLPEHFLREQTVLLQGISGERMIGVPMPSLALPDPLTELLGLEAAEERAITARQRTTIESLTSALSSGDTDLVRSMLSLPDTAAALASVNESKAAPFLAGLAAKRDLFGLLQDEFLADPDHWLLAAFHPLTQGKAWAVGPALEADEESMLLRQILFPRSDSLSEGYSDLTVELWAADIARRLSASDDTTTFLVFFVPLLSDHVESLAAEGLPERAERYAHVAARIAQPHLASLPTDLQATVSRLARLEIEGTPRNDSLAASVTAEAVPAAVSHLPADHVVARSREAIQAAGGMMTDRTRIEAGSGSIARVQGVVFATVTGDRAVEFTYDAQEHAVTEVMLDGKTLPYVLPFDRYVEWVRGGMTVGR
jgi:hypothetical protein